MLWMNLIISLSLTCIILSTYICLNTGRASFAVSLAFISLLFDDFTSIPKSIDKQLFYRIIFAVWGPIAVLLINCYSGLMVSQLNAPLHNLRPKIFEDLICHNRHILDVSVNTTLFNKTVEFDNYVAYWGIGYRAPPPNFTNVYASDTCYSILSTPMATGCRGFAPYFWHCDMASIFENIVSIMRTFVDLTREQVLFLLLFRFMTHFQSGSMQAKETILQAPYKPWSRRILQTARKKAYLCQPYNTFRPKGLSLLKTIHQKNFILEVHFKTEICCLDIPRLSRKYYVQWYFYRAKKFPELGVFRNLFKADK
ncbi:hypothetical protein Fcan01_25822 [Folsomia candida]|uniref:Uncharacterized protein n=1 Tax=Folsomia candida TaxID=158441 RepID=A0A226D3K5_FOLCA|nr:hypothetical protein Fcan01_25822 [Folsomia candida]